MTKIDLVEKINTQLGFSKKESSELVESVISIIKTSLAFGEDVKIPRFGNFEVKQKRDRKGRNPATGETITIGARRIIGFKLSAVLKDEINNQDPWS